VNPAFRPTHPRDESGVALLVAVLLLLMVSAIGVAAMDHSRGDSEQSGSSRRATITFHAADAAIQRGLSQLQDSPARLDAFQATLADGTIYRSGARSASGAQPIPAPETGPPPSGYAINLGAGYLTHVYNHTVSAFGPGNASLELQARYSKLEAGMGTYR
jgi:hypothetical protein